MSVKITDKTLDETPPWSACKCVILPLKMKPSCSNILTRSLREPGGPCTKSVEVSESRMERVNIKLLIFEFSSQYYETSKSVCGCRIDKKMV